LCSQSVREQSERFRADYYGIINSSLLACNSQFIGEESYCAVIQTVIFVLHFGDLSMPQRPFIDDFVSAPRRKLLTLLALIAIVYTATASAGSRSVERNTLAIPTLAARSGAAITVANRQQYLPLIKVPPCTRSYSVNSPWNTPISSKAEYDPLSSTYVAGFSGIFGSDPTQYTYPVYEVDAATPKRIINVSGYFSEVVNDTTISNVKSSPVAIPLPADATPSAGSDSQIVFWNRETGDEWGLTGAIRSTNGTWSASSGYHYNTNWDAAPPVGNSKFASRGAGLPFMAGLVRPCEIKRTHIDHALAFAYPLASPLFISPASKSDGESIGLPEGARIQLDPALTDQQIEAWGCTGSCLTIAHALQEYGMILVDRSDHPKLYAEDDVTAYWNNALNATTISQIPYTAFKVLKLVP
jgi:hypothetical protein